MGPGILQAIGGLGLFILGRLAWTDGLRAFAGGALRRVLARSTRSPLVGAATGAAATVAVQSSSVTILATVGFVGAGLLTFPQALGVVFGANVGSTATGWIVALLGFRLEIGTAVLPLAFVAALLALLGNRRFSRLGDALGGFCLLFLGIEFLQQGMAGLEDRITPAHLPPDTPGGRLLLVLIGAVIAILAQSSAAGVAMALSALGAGAITWSQGAAMVIGMDIGTTAAAFIATIGASVPARRTGYAHVVFNVMTAAGALLLLSPFAALCERFRPGFLAEEPELGLVAFHTSFNVLGAAAALPFASSFARLIVRLVPSSGLAITDPLDPHLLHSPELAVPAAGEALRCAARDAGRSLAVLLGTEGRRETGGADLEAALLEVRGYLERLSSGRRIDGVERTYAAAIHVLDHLERLVERLGHAPRLGADRIGPELEGIRARLEHEAAILTAVSADSPATDGAIHALWEELEDGSGEFRKEMLRRCAAGELSLDGADDRLDAHRWLRRSAYHIWRIRHHLGELGAESRG